MNDLIVVEDSDEDYDTVLEAATACGVADRVRRATDGDECLRLLAAGARRTAVVVLMDLGLPGTDGRAALAAIRADEALAGTPVVVFSASANPRDLEHCYRHGVNAYHVKPHRYVEHRDLVRQVIDYWTRRVRLPNAAG